MTSVPAVSSTTGSSGTTATQATSSSSSSSDLGLDPQAFLKLLAAQLKYQDPTNPTDTSSFMTQTATLSQVQAMSSMNTTLTSLASAQQAQTATSMIGKLVTWTDATTKVSSSGVVTSAALASSGATLNVGATSVPLSSITNVAEANTGT